MLIGVSHDEGISIIDIDRRIAEVGGDQAVVGAARYSEIGVQTFLYKALRTQELWHSVLHLVAKNIMPF
jgi:hypothetical protein